MNESEKSIVEKVLLQTLQEQKIARRWKIFFRLIWMILFIVVVIAIGAKQHSDDEKIEQKHVAVIDLNGVINADNQTYTNIAKSLKKALKDKNTIAVIIRANSPGGSPIYSDMLYNEIKRLQKIYPKQPIDVAVEEMCASGCYYISSAANNIYANPASIVGSIGVIYMGFGANKAMDKLGIDSRLLTGGKYKAMGYPFIPENKEITVMQQQMVDEVHDQFIAAVKNGRGTRLKNDPDLFTGRYWIGQDALKLGLIDGFGTVDSIARDKYHTDNIVDFTYKDKGFDRLMKNFGDDLVDSARQVVDVPVMGKYQ